MPTLFNDQIAVHWRMVAYVGEILFGFSMMLRLAWVPLVRNEREDPDPEMAPPSGSVESA